MREYLNVGQMSALFHLNKQTLQYYDREKIFSPAYRNPENNYRMYRFDQVYGLALICYLRKLGFSIAQVKKYLDLHDRSSAIQELKMQSALLQQHCQKMLAMDEVLQRKLQYVEQQLEQSAVPENEAQTGTTERQRGMFAALVGELRLAEFITDPVKDIVGEEGAALLSGDRSPEEAAALISERTALLLSELG